MKRVNGSLLTRFFQLSTAFVALPLLMGAKGGCSAGGDVPVGSDDHLSGCGPHACDDKAATLEAKLCSDGSGVGRTVCAEHTDGTCFWDFPACPTVDAAAPTSCGPNACDGLARTEDAKICPDGTGVGRSVCAKNASGACFWDFPACPAPALDAGSSECGPTACDKLPKQDDAKVCPDGTGVGRSVCAKNTNGVCFWDFPACPVPAVDSGTNACGAHACDGLASTLESKICPDGTGVGRTVCAKNASGSCFWDFPACPTLATDAGACSCAPDMKWGMSGGLAAYDDESRLTSCTQYQRVRNYNFEDRPNLICEETLPKCASGLASGQLITSALDRSDVKAAIQAAPVAYGADNRPADGQVFRIQIGTAVIEVGDPCGSSAACTPIPAGVQQLVTALKNIDNQELKMAPCATVFP